MSRKHTISVIEALYPADSHIPEIGEIGERLFLEALAINWRLADDRILETYRRLCEVLERTGKHKF